MVGNGLPDNLRAFCRLDDDPEARVDLATILTDPQKKGELISLAALAETEVGNFLTSLVARPERADLFDTIMEDNLTFYRKTELLKKAFQLLGIESTEYANHISLLDKLRILRNKAAHSFGVSPELSNRLVADKVIREIILDFPKTLFSKVEELNKFLADICNG